MEWIVLIIATILIPLTALWLISLVQDKEWGQFSFACLLLVTEIWLLILIATHPQPQVVRCAKIKQIDTLYKNDSIIGYEIIYME